MNKEIVLSLKNVTKTFKIPHERRDTLKEHFTHFFRRLKYTRLDAVKSVDIEVIKGEFLGIIGRNGGGKSTLLKLLAGIYLPTKGKIKVNGMISPFLELGVGFNADLTGKENVYLNGTILGLSRGEIDAKYQDIVDFAELHDFMDTKIKNYSSGMHVRLAFSIAIQADADIYLCDEVLAVGDMVFQQKCFDVFHRLKNEGKTIIYVSHDIGSVRRFCDRCVLLSKGEVVASGDPGVVIDKYIYEGGEIAAAATLKDEQDMSHLSSKKAVIEAYQLLDKNGKPCTNFCPGDSLRLRVNYRVNDTSLKNVNAGVAIYDERGNHLFGETSFWQNVALPSPQGSYEFEIKEIPLLSGKYFITIALNNEAISEQYDWVNKKIFFNVENNKIQEGIINFKTGWKLT